MRASDFVHGWRKLVDPREAAHFQFGCLAARFDKVDDIVADKLAPGCARGGGRR